MFLNSFAQLDLISILFDGPTRFTFAILGIAGLVGGDAAMAAMTSVHVYESKRWLGWYNTPGSFQLAKWFKLLSHISYTTSDATYIDTTILCDQDPSHSKAPKFRACFSGTVIEETSDVATLVMKECAAQESEERVMGRITQRVNITVVTLCSAPPSEKEIALRGPSVLLFSSIPIAMSVGACALCGCFGDWYALSSILIGIIASGVSSFALGFADLVFIHPTPAKPSPAGDGVLSSDRDMVLLKGTEGAVNAITRGKFALRFSKAWHADLIWWCSILLFIQSVAQLLLIPQACLLGQVMFMISLGVSAMYNLHLSSRREKDCREILFEQVLENPRVTKCTLGTHTAAVAFVLLVLQPQDPPQENMSRLLDQLLPNNTRVWNWWKATILRQLSRAKNNGFTSESDPPDEFTQQEKELFRLLYEDAKAAYDTLINTGLTNTNENNQANDGATTNSGQL